MLAANGSVMCGENSAGNIESLPLLVGPGLNEISLAGR
jgi:phosphoenolpyruvate-protein kinase (PTS system EI component)